MGGAGRKEVMDRNLDLWLFYLDRSGGFRNRLEPHSPRSYIDTWCIHNKRLIKVSLILITIFQTFLDVIVSWQLFYLWQPGFWHFSCYVVILSNVSMYRMAHSILSRFILGFQVSKFYVSFSQFFLHPFLKPEY